MIIFPAIDLKNGACVRLEQGEMARAQIFNRDPCAQAVSFAKQGFEWLHLVDLDGATGQGHHHDLIRDMIGASHLKIQIGGGIRDLAQIEFWLSLGVSRVILGTLAWRKPELARLACQRFPNQIIIALDAMGDDIAISGWQEKSSEKLEDGVKRVSDWGSAAILYTDIARDGMKAGLNLESIFRLSLISAAPIIASGGLKSGEDIDNLIALKSDNIEGVIAGRALYDNLLDVPSALKNARESQC